MEEAQIGLDNWISERKNTVRWLRELAKEIQDAEDTYRKIKLAGTSVSVSGSTIAIGAICLASGPVAAACAAVATAIASGGGLAVAISELASRISQLQGAKHVDKALKRDRKATITFYEKMAWIVEKRRVPGDAVNEWSNVAVCAGNFGYDAYQAGKTVATGTAEAAGNFGIALSGVFLLCDVYAIVKTLAEIYNGDVLKVVQDIRSKAQKLENEIEYYKKKVSASFKYNRILESIVGLLFLYVIYYIWYYVL